MADYKALAKEVARRRKKRTIAPQKAGQKPITFTPGGLHASLGVPRGRKLTAQELARAKSGAAGPKAKKQALFAQNVLHR